MTSITWVTQISVARRVEEHNIGKGGKILRACMQWTLVYYKEFSSRSDAINEEEKLSLRKTENILSD